MQCSSPTGLISVLLQRQSERAAVLTAVFTGGQAYFLQCLNWQGVTFYLDILNVQPATNQQPFY